MNLIVVNDGGDVAQAKEIAARLAIPVVAHDVADFELALTRYRLELREVALNAPGPVYVDFVGGAVGHRRRFGGGRGQLIAKAVGIKKGFIPDVIDATAGLARDAFVLAQLGCSVRLIERSPVVAELLRDGLDRAVGVDEVGDIVQRMHLLANDACDVLLALSQEQKPDVVYVDPMYPGREKTALVKKEMRLFQRLIGKDLDAPALLNAALAVAKKRVVVKRPSKADAIAGPSPDVVYKGKSTRFDVYFVPKGKNTGNE